MYSYLVCLRQVVVWVERQTKQIIQIARSDGQSLLQKSWRQPSSELELPAISRVARRSFSMPERMDHFIHYIIIAHAVDGVECGENNRMMGPTEFGVGGGMSAKNGTLNIFNWNNLDGFCSCIFEGQIDCQIQPVKACDCAVLVR